MENTSNNQSQKKIPAHEAWMIFLGLLISFPILGEEVELWQEEGISWTLISLILSAISTLLWLTGLISKKESLRKFYPLPLLFNLPVGIYLLLMK